METDSPISSLQTVSSSTPPAVSPITPSVISPSRDRPVFDAYQLLPSAGTLQSRSEAQSEVTGAGNSNQRGVSRNGMGSYGSGNLNMGSTMLDFSLDLNPPPSTAARPTSSSIKSSIIGGGGGSIPNFTQYDQSPYPFPQLDLNSTTPGSSFSFPPFQPDPLTSGPQLDPSVENLLANYFPTPQQQQQQQQNINTNNGVAGNGTMTMGQNPETWGTVPDDFLSRVFSFSWDTATPSSGASGVPTNGWGQQPQQTSSSSSIPSRQGLGVGMNGGPSMGQGRNGSNNQNQHRGVGEGISSSTLGQGQNQAQGTDFVPHDWGTSSGGWMA